MSLEVEATYENGVLKPSHELALREGEKVKLTIEPEKTAGKRQLMQWKGSVEDLEYLVESDENSHWASDEE